MSSRTTEAAIAFSEQYKFCMGMAAGWGAGYAWGTTMGISDAVAAALVCWWAMAVLGGSAMDLATWAAAHWRRFRNPEKP